MSPLLNPKADTERRCSQRLGKCGDGSNSFPPSFPDRAIALRSYQALQFAAYNRRLGRSDGWGFLRPSFYFPSRRAIRRAPVRHREPMALKARLANAIVISKDCFRLGTSIFVHPLAHKTYALARGERP